jgi:uncharacterized protein YbbK (DUF523 family)
MLLAYHPDFLANLRTPTPEDPLRLLVSGCLAAWPCGIDGTDYGMGKSVVDLLALPTVRPLAFCPEQHALGTPRTMPDLHGGDGVQLLLGKARVLDEHGTDLSAKMIEGAQAMLAFARAERAELALLTDMSAACGSQVISDGCRFETPRRFQKGVGVATATLLEAGIAVLSQRDFATLAQLRAKLEPGYVVAPELLDHHEHAWTIEHLPAKHPRA